MNIYEAFKLIRDANMLLERDMTPEQREAAKLRRQMRLAEKSGRAVNSGAFAVILGNCYPTPKFFNSHKPVGTSDEVIKSIQENNYKSGSGEILGFYPTRKKAREVAISITERIFKSVTDTSSDKGSAAYKIHSVISLPGVVEYTEANKEWCSDIRGPGDRGYLYRTDREIKNEIFDMRDSMVDSLERGAAADVKEARRRREWAMSRNNPDSPNFKNIYAHH